MTAEQYAYWMQGFTELTNGEMPTEAQWKMMKEHLATVFHKVTPPFSADPIDPSKIAPVRPNDPYPSPVVPYDLRWFTPRTSTGPLIATCTTTC